jgi:hypothetical protein
MDNLDMQESSRADLTQLEARCNALRQLVTSLLVLMIVVSGTLSLFLLRQVRYSSRDLEALRPQAMQLITEYQKTSGPAMDEFVKKITEYGQAHPDFKPIMTAYGLDKTEAGPKPPAPTPGPAPAADPKTKK